MRNNDWQALCKSEGFTCSDNDGIIIVELDNSRTQKVIVEDHDNAFLLRSIVVRASKLETIPDASLRAWIRNRTVSLVGFRVDERGRMVGEVWIPKAGLSALEWQLIVRHLARESDRLEFQLTGQDLE